MVKHTITLHIISYAQEHNNKIRESIDMPSTTAVYVQANMSLTSINLEKSFDVTWYDCNGFFFYDIISSSSQRVPICMCHYCANLNDDDRKSGILCASGRIPSTCWYTRMCIEIDTILPIYQKKRKKEKKTLKCSHSICIYTATHIYAA